MFGMSPGKNCAALAAGLRDAMDTQGHMGIDRLFLERLLVEVEFLCGQHRYRDQQTLLVKSPPPTASVLSPMTSDAPLKSLSPGCSRGSPKLRSLSGRTLPSGGLGRVSLRCMFGFVEGETPPFVGKPTTSCRTTREMFVNQGLAYEFFHFVSGPHLARTTKLRLALRRRRSKGEVRMSEAIDCQPAASRMCPDVALPAAAGRIGTRE